MAAEHQASDPHTLHSESGTEIDTDTEVVLMYFFLIRKEISFPNFEGDLHIHLIGENSVSWPPLSAIWGKRTPDFLDLCTRGQTREKGVSSQLTTPATIPSCVVQGYGYFYLYRASDCLGLDQ